MNERKTQYGVQIVWADPVAAGATIKGEEYIARWHWFDADKQATAFIESYIYDIGRDAQFGGVAEINRGTRWAIEEYGDVEVNSSIKEPCNCECHVWTDKVNHNEPCCDVMKARLS